MVVILSDGWTRCARRKFKSQRLHPLKSTKDAAPGLEYSGSALHSGGEAVGGDGAQLPGLEGGELCQRADVDAEGAFGLAIDAGGDGVAVVDDEFGDRGVEKEME